MAMATAKVIMEFLKVPLTSAHRSGIWQITSAPKLFVSSYYQQGDMLKRCRRGRLTLG